MRAIDCPCDTTLKEPTTKSSSRLPRQHVEEHHSQIERSDEQRRARVTADADGA